MPNFVSADPEAKKNTFIILVLIIGSTVAILSGIGLYFALKKNTDEQPTTSPLQTRTL